MQNDKQAAMSRALGAAFLSHQVEQLERSVVGGRGAKGATSSNWRERERGRGGGGKRGAAPHIRKKGGSAREREHSDTAKEEDKDTDADTVVVDASVLVHALGTVKKWCREGRREVVLIPLEALNTLDLLKKGSSPLAQRARAASRILEAQVGTNPRIKVQRDDAFVPWDEIPFDVHTETAESANLPPPLPPPEWLRRTICCGRWELLNADAPSTQPHLFNPTDPSLSRTSTPTPSSHSSSQQRWVSPAHHNGAKDKPKGKDTRSKVVLAVVATSSALDMNSATTATGRYERVDGSLVRAWAHRAKIEVLDVEPTLVPPSLPRPHVQVREREEEKKKEKEGKKLVEKPIAMSIVGEQPVKVLRVLARGEKLDP